MITSPDETTLTIQEAMKAKKENAHGGREVSNGEGGGPCAGPRRVTGDTMSRNGHNSQAGSKRQKGSPSPIPANHELRD